MTTVVIAGGGTGGHVFPMLAVGEAIERIEPSARVVYVGTGRGIEGRVIGALGAELVLMDVVPLRGGGVAGFVRGATRAAGSIPEARKLVRRVAPDVVLSVGGYAGGPISLAAHLMGVPVALLEPNSVLGLSNRLLTPFAKRAYLAFPEAERLFRPSVVRRLGVPLRSAFALSPYTPTDGGMSVLVLGGSQGARGLNDVLPRAIAEAKRAGASLDVTHQAGRDREDAVRVSYAELDLCAESKVIPFIADVASAIAAADVVVGRAGASSLAELCAVGRASILVPYPFAADDHQQKNARSIERAGAAIAIAERDATPARLAGELLRLAADPPLRTRMARAAASLGRADAAAQIAQDLLSLAHSPRRMKEAA